MIMATTIFLENNAAQRSLLDLDEYAIVNDCDTTFFYNKDEGMVVFDEFFSSKWIKNKNTFYLKHEYFDLGSMEAQVDILLHACPEIINHLLTSDSVDNLSHLNKQIFNSLTHKFNFGYV